MLINKQTNKQTTNNKERLEKELGKDKFFFSLLHTSSLRFPLPQPQQLPSGSLGNQKHSSDTGTIHTYIHVHYCNSGKWKKNAYSSISVSGVYNWVSTEHIYTGKIE